MEIGLLIPLLVPLITEIVKQLLKQFDTTPPRVTLPASGPVTGVGLASLMNIDPVSGGLLGLAGSGVYEIWKSLWKK